MYDSDSDTGHGGPCFQGDEERFVERWGRFFEADAAPRTAGRLLGLMLLTPGELTLDEIAERLQVSKASVSTNARLLESWGALERTSHLGDRRDFYRVGHDVEACLLGRLLERAHQVQSFMEEGSRTASARDRRVECRFRSLRDLHERAVSALEEAVRRLAPRGPAGNEETR